MDALFFHPKLVHLPIGLAVVMPIVALVVALGWWRGWFQARTWVVVVLLQALLVGGALLSMKSGEREEHRVAEVVGRDLIHAHEDAAKLFTIGESAVLALALLALLAARKPWARSVALLAALGSGAALYLGYRAGQAGGELVYEHGAAEAGKKLPTPTAPVPRPPKGPLVHGD